MIGNSGPIGDDDLQALLDDRLAPTRRAAVEAWLAEHEDVAERMAAERRDRDLLRTRLAAKFAEPIPPRLRVANIAAARSARRNQRLRSLAAAVVLFVTGVGVGALVPRSPPPDAVARATAPTTVPMAVADEAGSAYRTFVVEVAHPVEVDAGREAHLMQWLSKRLGRRLVAPDLSGFEFRLMGGRLLSAETGPAAQLMYENAAGKRLTIYVQAAKGDQTAFLFRRDDTAATFAWIDGDFGFAVTAATDREHLLPIAEAVYRGFDGRPARDG